MAEQAGVDTGRVAPVAIKFPTCEESDSSCGETTEAEDNRRGGYHPARVGETFKSGRYRALCRLGSGHFSTVWLCYDSANSELSRGRVVALKIQKSASGYTDAAHDEIRILESIDKAAAGVATPVVRLLDSFEHTGVNGRHVCLAFDVMGASLLHLIKRFNFSGVPIPLVRRVTRDLLVGLDFLHTSARVIHTDLKPENVLMCIPPDDLRKLDTEGADFNRELLDRKLTRGRNGGFGQGAPFNSDDAEGESKGQRRRRKRKLRVHQARQALEAANGNNRNNLEAAAGNTLPNPTDTSKNTDAEENANNSTTSVDDSSNKEQWDSNAAPITPETSVNGAVIRETSTRAVGSSGQSGGGVGGGGPGNGHTGGVPDIREFSLKDVIDMDRVFAAGRCAIVDLGNACWIDHQFTGDIQTRQYRSPEVIIGAPYNTAADMFSVACIVFELLTGEYLFDPHSSMEYDRDEDHLAQMMELLGPIPRYLTSHGRYARDLFTRNGELRNVRVIREFPLNMVLMDKFGFNDVDAELISSFLLPMLDFDPAKRATAAEALHHPFLRDQ